MSQLWLARLEGKHAFDKIVALKTISPKFALDAEFQQMFLDEARVVSSLTHPNVAQVLDLGEERGVLFLVMEWIDGESLINVHRAATREEREHIPFGILLRIMADACTGLQAAHELTGDDGMSLGLVHRDISPHNLLVGFNGTTKVIDFGIAKARNRSAKDTQIGVLKGRIPYMAPEQAMGLAVDRRTDIWSAGATMYRMLAGQVPYSASDPVAVLRRIVQGDAPNKLPATLPEPIRSVVDRALARNADERFQSADEMRAALEKAMRDTDEQTTHQQVAALMAEHLGESRALHARQIEHAVRDSRARMRMQPRLDSGSGAAWAVSSNGYVSQPTVSSAEPPNGPWNSDNAGAAHSAADLPAAIAETPEDDSRPTVPVPATEDSSFPASDARKAARIESIPIPLRWRRRSVVRASLWAVTACLLGALVVSAFPLRASSQPQSSSQAGGTEAPPAPTAPTSVETRAQTSSNSPVPSVEVRLPPLAESALPTSTSTAARAVPNARAETQAAEHVSVPYLLDRARDARRAGRGNEAAALFAAAVAQDPTNSEALTGLGDIEQTQGATTSAIAEYRRALAVNPRYLPAYLGLADALWKSGQLPQAQSEYRGIIDQFPARLLPDRVRERAAITR
jgi:serine/threonine protein kinase